MSIEYRISIHFFSAVQPMSQDYKLPGAPKKSSCPRFCYF